MSVAITMIEDAEKLVEVKSLHIPPSGINLINFHYLFTDVLCEPGSGSKRARMQCFS
jgi:hypothetical protein